MAACLFEHLDIVPQYDAFLRWEEEVGEDGLCAAWFAGAASPVHHIQKYFLDATEFFFHYHDYQKEMRGLAEAMTPLYEKALRLIAESPARAVDLAKGFMKNRIEHSAKRSFGNILEATPPTTGRRGDS